MIGLGWIGTSLSQATIKPGSIEISVRRRQLKACKYLHLTDALSPRTLDPRTRSLCCLFLKAASTVIPSPEAMDTHGWPYVFDRHSNLEIIGTLQVHKSQIHVVQFSPDGKYLASGDDNGILIVRISHHVASIYDADIVMIKVRKTTKNWPRIRTYRTGRAIRALVWHPTINGTVVVGSGSGELNTLKLAPTSAEVNLKS